MGCYTSEFQRLRFLRGAIESSRREEATVRVASVRGEEEDDLARELLALQPCATPNRSRARVVHVIGSLGPGGAERQLVYLARESLRRGGIEARILLTNPLTGSAAHYLPLAQAGGVTVEVAGETCDEQTRDALCIDHDFQRRLGLVDPRYQAYVTELACEFRRLQPDVVHAWLDHANVWSGIAALISGVPNIVLSVRNVNPSNFPNLYSPYLLAWYRKLAACARVQFLANSRVGAADYSHWAGVKLSRFSVIPNGIDKSVMDIPNQAQSAQLRRDLQVDGKRLVLGVFRLSEEKEPLDFVRAARIVLSRMPDSCVLLAGDGPMRGEVEKHAQSMDPSRFRLLGRRDDVAALLSIADVVMHTSRREGTPNALLEAQALGCPVVATAGGGTVDAVLDELTGFLLPIGDAEGLASRTIQLLANRPMRARMSARAQKFVERNFALETMVSRSLECYERVVPYEKCVRVTRPAMDALPLLEAPRGCTRVAIPKRPRVVHVIGCLTPGGAERQLATYASVAHTRRLASHTVVTFHPAVGPGAFFRPLLAEAGVDVRALAGPSTALALERLRTDHRLRARLCAIPPELGPEPIAFISAILSTRAHVVHTWLDHSNVLAGIAALALGIDRVVFSLRSVSPPNFPAWYGDWMHSWYQALSTSPRVRFVANSEHGARDYARWIGIDASRIAVINNGVDPAQFTDTDPGCVARLRAELRATGRPLLVGAFRLVEEKRPHQFIEIARRLLRRVPNARIVISGDGPMREEMERATEDIRDSFTLLGRRTDVSTMYAAANATLLCSRVEGFPNVLMEAQFLGCPVVSSDAGGARETFLDGETGFLHECEDVDGMASSLARLCSDDALRKRFSQAARAFALERFDLERMVRLTNALYHSA